MDNTNNNNNSEKGHVDVNTKDIPAIAPMANFFAEIEFPIDKKEIVNFVENKNTLSDKSQDVLKYSQ